MRRVVLVHTVTGMVPVFQELAKGLPRDVKVSNIVDESLLEDAITAGGLTHSVNRRVVDPILSAADSGAVAVLATCSSIGPCRFRCSRAPARASPGLRRCLHRPQSRPPMMEVAMEAVAFRHQPTR